MFLVIEGDHLAECESYSSKLVSSLLEFGVDVACLLPSDWYEKKLGDEFKQDKRCSAILTSLDFYAFEHRCKEQLDKGVSVIVVWFHDHHSNFRLRQLRADVVVYLRNHELSKENYRMEKFDNFMTRNNYSHWTMLTQITKARSRESINKELFRVMIIHLSKDQLQSMDNSSQEHLTDQQKDVRLLLTKRDLAEEMRRTGKVEEDAIDMTLDEDSSRNV